MSESIIVPLQINLNAKLLTIQESWALGFKSRPSWKKFGHVVAADAAPSGYVLYRDPKFNKTETPNQWEMVVREEGKYKVCTQDFYPVFPKQEEQSSINITSLPLPLSSFVLPDDQKSECKSLQNMEFTTKIITKKSGRGRPHVNNEFFAYSPPLEQHHEEALGEDLEKALCVIHSLYHFRFFAESKKRKRADDWIELGSKYCEKFFGKWHHWTRLRDNMLTLGIMEQTKVETFELLPEHQAPRGRKGQLAYAYRLREDYRRAKHTRRPLRHPDTINLLLRHKGEKLLPVHRWLEKNLHRLSVLDVPDWVIEALAQSDSEDEGTIEAKAGSYRESLRWLSERSIFGRVDKFSRRFHSNLTQLKKELRQYLRVDGEKLCQIDIKCCQPLLIGLLAKQAGFEDERYLRICEADLYQFLAEKLGLSRKSVKTHFAQKALFSSNRSICQTSKVMLFFKKEFPKIFEFMKQAKSRPKTKDNPKPHNHLAYLAQSAEVDFVIHTVCERLRKERPEMFLATIHDSLVMLRTDAEYVKMVMSEEFAHLNLNPNLQVENYGD